MTSGIYTRSEETRKKISKSRKGIKLSEETKEKISKSKKERYTKGLAKSWNKGKKETRKEVLEKQSKSHLGKPTWNKGKKGLPKHSEEHKRKISNSLKGHKVSKEARKKLSEQREGIKLSDKTKRKISKNRKGKGKGIVPWNKGLTKENDYRIKKIALKNKGKKASKETILKLRNKKLTKEHKKKLRIAAIKYIKEVCGGICPMLGRNEKKILDDLEQELNYKIIRQYQVEGYFVDGYIQELNLCIEVDERPKNKERDIERERIIKEKLNCKFLRINDFD